MEEKEVLEKIYGEIKRLADMAEDSMRKYKEYEKAIPQAKKPDVWEEARAWFDSIFRDIIMREIRESAPKMGENVEDMYNVLYRVATIIRTKKKIMQYLSEDGILKLDEELRNAEQKLEEDRDKLLEKINEAAEGKYNNDIVSGTSGELSGTSNNTVKEIKEKMGRGVSEDGKD